jgi:MoaA/NifB/PqqE/SkfB family radical SAM enzyme
MRAARNIVNSLFSVTASHLAALSPSVGADVYKAVRSFTAFMGRPLPEELDPRVVHGTIELIADGLRRTPYGSPLELEYPLFITLSAQSYCPFACTNCYSNSGVAKARGRTDDRMQLFAKVAAARTPFVIVSGGEPLVAEGIEDGLELLVDSGKFVWVSTNALVDKYVEFARRNEGSLCFILPVWGNRERHNSRRGVNSFERVERNLQMLNAAGQKANILVVLADDDFSVFDDVERLLRTYRVDVVTITRRIDTGRVEVGPFELGPDQRRRLELWQKTLKPHVRMVVCDLPEMQEAKGSSRMQRMLGLPSHNGCSAGNWMMHIDDAGQGYACFSFEGQQDQSIAGHVSIAEQWRAVRDLRAEFPTGALCVEKSRARQKAVAL